MSDLPDGGVTMLRYWFSERTLWLADVFGEPTPLGAPSLPTEHGGTVGVDAAHDSARLARGTCHELRHFTRLREAGMSLEALQAQAGHRSISSTQIYLHLANDWLAGEYKRAAEAIDARGHLGERERAS